MCPVVKWTHDHLKAMRTLQCQALISEIFFLNIIQCVLSGFLSLCVTSIIPTCIHPSGRVLILPLGGGISTITLKV